MTTAAELRNIAMTQLIGATLAGVRVFTPRTYPTWDGSYPMIFLQPPDEMGVSAGPNGTPAYQATATLIVAARVEAPVLAKDAGAIAALVQLETMLSQIKRQLINNPAFWRAGLQEFSDFRSKCSVHTDASVIGEGLFSIDMIYRQDADQFYQEDTLYLEAIDAGVAVPDGTPQPGVTVELYPSDEVAASIAASAAALDQLTNIDLPAATGEKTTQSE